MIYFSQIKKGGEIVKISKIGIIFLLIMSVAFLSYAATSNVTVGQKGGGSSRPWVKSADVKGTSDKIERGVTRLLLGWTEIPKSIVSTTKESRNPFCLPAHGSFSCCPLFYSLSLSASLGPPSTFGSKTQSQSGTGFN